MTRIEFFVPGKPRPQTRQKFRVAQRRGASGGKPGDYVPIPYGDSTGKEKSRVASICLAAMAKASAVMHNGPVALLVNAHFHVPTSLSKREAASRVWHTQKPDADNLLKLVKDALTGVAWHDDAQVFAPYPIKTWSQEQEGVEVVILQLDPAPEKAVEEWQAMVREVNLFLWHAGQDLAERLEVRP